MSPLECEGKKKTVSKEKIWYYPHFCEARGTSSSGRVGFKKVKMVISEV